MPDMPDANGAHENAGNVASTSPHAYTMPGHKGFLPGNPGRTWKQDKRSKSAQEIIDAYGTEPLALKMQQMQRLQQRIDNDCFEDSYARIETEKLLDKVTADVMQYRHQRLKSVEHHATLEIIQQLQQLDTLSDDQLKLLMDQAEDLMKQLPPGR